MTTHANQELLQIMQRHSLNHADISKALGVPVYTVESWTAAPGSARYDNMPPLELRLLQYSLMTENTRYHLF